jgi:hypothetical protein
VTSTSYTPLCDVIFAVDIDEINVSSYISDDNEFVLKGKGIRLVFSSPKRHDIIQAYLPLKRVSDLGYPSCKSCGSRKESRSPHTERCEARKSSRDVIKCYLSQSAERRRRCETGILESSLRSQ